MKIQIEFSPDEVTDAIRVAYESRLGKIPDGYEFHVTRKYGYSDEVEVNVYPVVSEVVQLDEEEVAS